MQWQDVQFQPDRRTLRQFAGLWIIFFGGLAAISIVRGRPVMAAVCGALALTVGPLGLAIPAAVKWIYVGWMVLAFPIGFAVSWTMLGLLYFGMFTPIAFVQRWMGRDVLARRRVPSRTTYWVTREAPRDAASYFRQS